MKDIFTFISLILISQISFSTSGHTAKEWQSRAIYQIITDRWARNDAETSECDLNAYCGGNWASIINHLDYIKNMGFDAIWISPIVENIENNYHGYGFSNINKVNSHFGTEEDLKRLVSECHKKDIWVMVDVVANHCGNVNEDFSKITPFNKAEYYHDKCDITDWDNQQVVENCRFNGQPDLKQEDNFVSETFYNWISDIVKTFDFDGIRVDTVNEVPQWFWDKFIKASGVFALGDVFSSKAEYVASYQGHLDGLVNYPLFYAMNEAFCGSDYSDFRNIEYYYYNTRTTFPNPELLGVFLENHDNPRFLSNCNNKKLFKNAVAFSLTWEGIPVFYYGGEQYFSGGSIPENREPFWGNYDETKDIYLMIKKINAVRKEIKFYEQEIKQSYADIRFYAYFRGEMFVAVSNTNGCSRKISYHPFHIGDIICNIFDENDCIKIAGKFNIELGDEPKIYITKETLQKIKNYYD